jgi:hypothetical protein
MAEPGRRGIQLRGRDVQGRVGTTSCYPTALVVLERGHVGPGARARWASCSPAALAVPHASAVSAGSMDRSSDALAGQPPFSPPPDPVLLDSETGGTSGGRHLQRWAAASAAVGSGDLCGGGRSPLRWAAVGGVGGIRELGRRER